MIHSIRHKAVRALKESNDASKLPAEYVAKIRRILSRLDSATEPQQMNYPGSAFHALQGDLQGYYAVKVTGNWRITFRFEGEHAADVDYQDYH